ncbi:MAG: hypothetical protein U1F11_04390 [Steroidobacteraceae bacterium]
MSSSRSRTPRVQQPRREPPVVGDELPVQHHVAVDEHEVAAAARDREAGAAA